MPERPDVQESTFSEHGEEQHPAWMTIGAARVSHGPPGTYLFDSDIRHQHTMRVTIRMAGRRRDLHHDWIHGGREVLEIEMSEAQWASFVSTTNVGTGVPCTGVFAGKMPIEEWGYIPSFPFESRFAVTMGETRRAAHEAFDEIQEALAAYVTALENKAGAKERNAALDELKGVVRNAVPNVNYAGKRVTEHGETVVNKMKSDIEGYVLAVARQLDLDPRVLGSADQLPALVIEAAVDDDTDRCKACGHTVLFSGFFDENDLAVSDDSAPGTRWTTYCQSCGAEQ
jgi:hypothetical protein